MLVLDEVLRVLQGLGRAVGVVFDDDLDRVPGYAAVRVHVGLPATAVIGTSSLVPVAPLSELITPNTSGVPAGAPLAAAVMPDAAALDAGAAGDKLDDDEPLQAVMASALALASASRMK